MTCIKKIEAVVKDEQIAEIKDALEAAGFLSMTLTPVRGRGRQGGMSLEWRASTYKVDFLHRVMLTLVVKESDVQTITDILIRVCQSDVTGGGGKIFISPVDEVIRIRTGERGIDAL
jgi:nitrogen regulatory protein P-II 1